MWLLGFLAFHAAGGLIHNSVGNSVDFFGGSLFQGP
jgi:hypothetical protein